MPPDDAPQASATRRGSVGAFGVLGAATASIALAALPIFLLGALAIFIREELGFGEAALGVSASLYYLTSALSSIPGGRFAERAGARNAIAVAAAGSIVSMLGMAALARSWIVLTLFMMLAGAVNGVALPASNLALARRVPPRHQGVSFGLKQSAGPIATLLAGAAVPALGLTVGWRWAFVIAGVAPLPLLAIFRPSQRPGHAEMRRQRGRLTRPPLLVLACAAALGVVSGSTLAAFYVESAVASGVSPATAGTLLAAGSVLGIAARVGWGWRAGRRPDSHVSTLVVLLAVGSAGFAALGLVDSAPELAVATLVVFVFGWGWPGVFNYSIVLRSPAAPAVASGIVATGIYAGGIVGPVLFGAIVESSSYTPAWLLVGASMLGSAALMKIGGDMLHRSGAGAE